MSLETLREMAARGRIRAVDYHFARQIAGYARRAPDAIAVAAALAAVELGRGNVCVDLAAAGTALAFGGDALGVDAAALRAALREEREVCSCDGDPEPRPLVLDGNRLYLHRYWLAERRVAARLRDLAGREIPFAADARALLERLFADAPAAALEQKRACATAMSRALAVITGGPGTGKTTTVARLLLLLASEAMARGERIDIQLAAPTGKAAARVSEALARELQRLPGALTGDERIPALLPRGAQTLHRLLCAGSDGRFRHNRDNPLAADVVVIDESSMVDLRLLDALLQALPRTARLVLLGDRDQLASVEAGNVFGGLCAAGPGAGGAVAATIAVLSHSFRFGAGSGIARIAGAVNTGDVETVAALLDAGAPDLDCLRYRQHLDQSAHFALRERFRPLVDAARRDEDPAAVLAALDSFRVLTPLRDGEFGVSGLNLLIERTLIEAGTIESGQAYYPGRPILVTRNDHGLRLYNGDVGVVLRAADGQLRVLFQQPGAAPRLLPVARLPQHESAFAMTVHKSQGSEFESVLLILPPTADDRPPPGGRELIYTAITRARQTLTLLLPEGPLDARWLQRSQARSGLAERLHGTP